jgi:hypothetical protein
MLPTFHVPTQVGARWNPFIYLLWGKIGFRDIAESNLNAPCGSMDLVRMHLQGTRCKPTVDPLAVERFTPCEYRHIFGTSVRISVNRGLVYVRQKEVPWVLLEK